MLGEYSFVQVDDYLIGEGEVLQYPRSTKRHRLKVLFQEDEHEPRYLLAETTFVFRYDTGSSDAGYLNFMCRLGPPGPHRLTRCFRAITDLKKSGRLPFFATRAMKQAFIDRYSGAHGLKPHELTEVYACITGDESVGSHGELDANIRERLCMFLDQDDETAANMVVDLRKLSKSSTIYDKYWQSMSKYLDAHEDDAKVNRARHGSTTNAPIAWSIPQLIKDVKVHTAMGDVHITEEETPSEEWVRLSFSPANPWIKSSAALHLQVRPPL